MLFPWSIRGERSDEIRSIKSVSSFPYSAFPLKAILNDAHTVFPNGNTRSFNHVITGANDNLRKVFGLELVELMTRAERDKVGAADDDAEEEAGPSRKKNKGTNSSYPHLAFINHILLIQPERRPKHTSSVRLSTHPS